MKRSTVDVEYLKETVNQIIAGMIFDGDKERAYRKGMIALLEDVLFKTNNYKGFQYLNKDQVPTGCMPGIHETSAVEYKFLDTDPTRVKYL